MWGTQRATLSGIFLFWSALGTDIWERSYRDGSIPCTWFSNIALSAWLPSFPPAISSLTSPWTVSLQSIADLSLGLLSNLYVPAPSHHTFQGTYVPVWGIWAVGRIVCVGCHSIQTVPDELLHSPRAQMLPLCPKQLPWSGDLTPISAPSLPGCRSSPAHSSFFLPSFISSCFLVCFIFFALFTSLHSALILYSGLHFS